MIQITLLDRKGSIPDKAHASDRTGQETVLFRGGFETIAYGFMETHRL